MTKHSGRKTSTTGLIKKNVLQKHKYKRERKHCLPDTKWLAQ